MRMGIALLLAWASAGCSERQAPPSPAEPVIQFERTSSDPVAHGERLATVLGCNGCHGRDLQGNDWSAPGFVTMYSANLTQSAARLSDAELTEAIQGGRRPDRDLWDMPSHLFTKLGDNEVQSVIAFIRTHPPKGPVHAPPEVRPAGQEEIDKGSWWSSAEGVRRSGNAWPPDAGTDHALGRYIVRATCAECHGMDLRGGQPTPDAKTRPDLRMVAGYDSPAFRRLLRTGKASGDREVSLMSQVARGRYAHFTEAEVEAVHRYLQRVAEIDP
jgi:mono/diheme cytochrome c family protein